jgi:hypothetical protein
MRGKILIVAGLAVGYVLGARAGRERYEDIKRTATKFWNDPRVQHQVETVEDFAKDKAPEVVDFISDNAKKVVSQVRSTTKKSGKGSSSAKSSTSSTPASGARKSPGTSSSTTAK